MIDTSKLVPGDIIHFTDGTSSKISEKRTVKVFLDTGIVTGKLDVPIHLLHDEKILGVTHKNLTNLPENMEEALERISELEELEKAYLKRISELAHLHNNL